jgi:hypothetical protein
MCKNLRKFKFGQIGEGLQILGRLILNIFLVVHTGGRGVNYYDIVILSQKNSIKKIASLPK